MTYITRTGGFNPLRQLTEPPDGTSSKMQIWPTDVGLTIKKKKGKIHVLFKWAWDVIKKDHVWAIKHTPLSRNCFKSCSLLTPMEPK